VYGKRSDEILMRYDPAVDGGQWFYFQQDHEGSVTHLTNWNNYNGRSSSATVMTRLARPQFMP
jgi:hypothetical protein